MGPVMFITGNAEHASLDATHRHGFNGAGDVHHRELGSTVADCAERTGASMGPVMFITGNAKAVAGARRGLPASMGPVMFITGNNPARPKARATSGRLQWGR